MYSTYVTNIRYEEKASIRNALTPGSILQIYGPPMAGKAVIVDQVIADIESTDHMNHYEVMCQGFSQIEDILISTMQNTDCTLKGARTIPNAVKKIKSILAEDKNSHHVFTFYKCERLRLDGKDHAFINFLVTLVNQCTEVNIRISVIFTTYILFPGLNSETIAIGMLTDPLDILSLLSRYAPEAMCLNAPKAKSLKAPESTSINATEVAPVNTLEVARLNRPEATRLKSYINICKHTLSFPEGIARIAEEFLNDREHLPSPECLLEMVSSDLDFLSVIFKKRVHEVDQWLSENEIRFVLSCRPSLLKTYTEDLLQEVYQNLNPSHNYQHWKPFLKRIRDKQVVQQELESNNLAIHPLVVFYCNTVRTSYDVTSVNSFSWNALFLCRVLVKVEDNIAILERSSLGTSHWLELRLTLNKAIHRPDDGSFDSFFKVCIDAGRLLYLNFPDDGKHFYNNLRQAAETLGSAGHRAIIEAHCGNISSYGAVIDWQNAEQRLESAMLTLKKEGMLHFYRWSAVRNAIISQRQSKHQKALKYYEAAKETIIQQSRSEVEDSLKVPKFQEDEEILTAEIYETIPMIYTGKAKEALDKLMKLNQNKQEALKNHVFYYIFLNNIGLAIERGENDQQKALSWYKKSLEERRTVGKINPQVLVLSLNNISALLLLNPTPESLRESEEYLLEALRLQKETHWHYRDRALTLNNLAKVYVKKLDFFKAFKFNVEALSVLQTKAKNSDFSLQVLLDLAHCRIILGLQSSQLEWSEPEFDKTLLDKSVEDYLQEIVDIERSSNVDSSDFHLMFLSACVHGMSLSGRGCRERFEKYESCFTRHIDRHGLFLKTGETIFKNEPYFLEMCRSLYLYLKGTEFEDMDVQIVSNYVVRFCAICVKLGENERDYPWKKEKKENNSASGLKESNDNKIALSTKSVPSSSNNSGGSSSPNHSATIDFGLDINDTVRNRSEPGGDSTTETGAESGDLPTKLVAPVVVNPSVSDGESNESVSDFTGVINKSMSYSDGRSACSSDTDLRHLAILVNPSVNSQISLSDDSNTCSSVTDHDLCQPGGRVINPSVMSTESGSVFKPITKNKTNTKAS